MSKVENIEIREWTDEDEIKNNLEIAAQLDDAFSPILNTIRQLDPNVKDLPSIGIYLNNKIVEIYREFKKQGVPYHHSVVSRSIIPYLTDLANKASVQLGLYVRSNEGFISMVKRLTGRSTGIQYLDAYRKICDEIFNFSLEKDAFRVVNNAVDQEIQQPWYSGGINQEIDFFNEELSRLGVPGKVEYREENRVFQQEIVSEEQLNELEQAIQEQLGETSRQNEELSNMLAEYSSDPEQEYQPIQK